ncbi:MAG: hypothetical protein K2H35_08180 [Muribaculaceae bacterium]|nr:hypothetical protein [Muribaculaceae bacterium]
MNTQNLQEEKLYLVSFGNSDQYILRDTNSGEKSSLMRIETELNSFLRNKFPDETFAYFTTPKVEDLGEVAAEQYSSYRKLDAAAIEEIKKVLVREVRDMESNDSLNSDAPYANVNPAAADIPHILG